MPTTPNGVSKFLAHKGFQRARWISQSNGPGMWSEGFHVEEEHGEIVVWAFTEHPVTTLLEIAGSLDEGGYQIDVDVMTRAIIVYDREEDRPSLRRL